MTVLAPVPRPPKLIGLGHNYHDHMGIGRTEPAAYPTFFCKTANTIIGPDQAIIIPAATSQVDYEAELAVVIGRRGRHVRPRRHWTMWPVTPFSTTSAPAISRSAPASG